jgi:hypothetical protein
MMIAILFATVSMTACGSAQTETVTKDSTKVDSLVIDSASVGSATTDSTAAIK